MKRLLFLCTVALQGWTLTCSDSIKISDIHGMQVMYPQIVSNEAGNTALCWKDYLEEGEEVVLLATKGESGWSSPMTISEPKYQIDDVFCQIATDGKIYVYWEDENDVIQGVKGHEGHWTKPVDLVDTDALDDDDVDFISILPDRQGRFMYLTKTESYKSNEWKNAQTIQITEKSIDTLEEKSRVINTSMEYGELAKGNNKKGEQFLFWKNKREIYDGKTTFSGLWQESDGSWGSVEKHSIAGEILIDEMNLAVDTKGNVCIVYLDYDDNLFSMTRSSDGKWSDPMIIAGDGENDISEFQIIGDDAGNFLLVWNQVELKKATIYAAYKPVDGKWSLPLQLTPSNELNVMPRVQLDPTGQFVLLWQKFKALKYLSIHGATFSPTAEQWSTPVQISPQGNYYLSSFAINAKGEKMIAWVTGSFFADTILEVAELSLD